MRMLRRISAGALLVALIIVVRLFPDHNRTSVDVDLIVKTIPSIELWLVLLITFAAGIGCALVASSFFWLKTGFLGRHYRKAISELEVEVHHLRNLPLAGGDLGDPDAEFDAVVGRAESRH